MMTKWMEDKFDQGYDFVQLGHSDAMPPERMCHCDRCNEMFGFLPKDATRYSHKKELGARIMIPHKAVLENLNKSRPGKYVMQTVYQATDRYITADEDYGLRLPPNAIAETGTCSVKDFALIKRAFTGTSVYDKWWNCAVYNYWWLAYDKDTFCPKHSPETIAAQVKKLSNYKVLGTYYCGGGDNWPAEAPAYYVTVRLVERPDSAVADMMKEFCDGLYGNAAQTMNDYYAAYYEKIVEDVNGQGSQGMGLYGGTFRDKYLTCWPEDKLVKLDGLLKKAESEASGDRKALGFIRLARIGYDEVAYTSRTFTAYAELEKNPTPEGAQKVKDAIAARNAMLDNLVQLGDKEPEFVASYFPNYKALKSRIEWSRKGKSALGKPFADWNGEMPK
jgi:hypothetical protein